MALQNPEQAELLKPKKRRNKMNAQGCRLNGIWFDSLGECGRYVELLAYAHVSCLKVHEVFWFRCGKSYEADFTYRVAQLDPKSGVWCNSYYVVEDVKGMMTPLAKMKLAMMSQEFGIKVKLVRPTNGHRVIARAAIAAMTEIHEEAKP